MARELLLAVMLLVVFVVVSCVAERTVPHGGDHQPAKPGAHRVDQEPR